MKKLTINKIILFLGLLSGQLTAYETLNPKQDSKAAPIKSVQPIKGAATLFTTPPALQKEIQEIKTAIAALPEGQATTNTIDAAVIKLLTTTNLASLSTEDIVFLEQRRHCTLTLRADNATIEHLVNYRFDQLQPKHLLTYALTDRLYHMLTPKNYPSWVYSLVEKHPKQVNENNMYSVLSHLPQFYQEKCALFLLSKVDKNRSALFLKLLIERLNPAQRDYWINYLVINHFSQIKNSIGDFIIYASPANQSAIALTILKDHLEEIDTINLFTLVAVSPEKERAEWSAFLIKNKWNVAKTCLGHYLSYLSLANKQTYILYILENYLKLEKFNNHYVQIALDAMTEQDRGHYIYNVINTDFPKIKPFLHAYFTSIPDPQKAVCASYVLKKHFNELHPVQIEFLLQYANTQKKDQ